MTREENKIKKARTCSRRVNESRSWCAPKLTRKKQRESRRPQGQNNIKGKNQKKKNQPKRGGARSAEFRDKTKNQKNSEHAATRKEPAKQPKRRDLWIRTGKKYEKKGKERDSPGWLGRSKSARAGIKREQRERISRRQPHQASWGVIDPLNPCHWRQ